LLQLEICDLIDADDLAQRHTDILASLLSLLHTLAHSCDLLVAFLGLKKCT
jgi:hypothetical protein